MVFFPFEKYGKKLILFLEDLDHVASNVFLKQSRLGGLPTRPDSPLDPGVGPIMAHVQDSPQGYVSDPISGFSRKTVNQ